MGAAPSDAQHRPQPHLWQGFQHTAVFLLLEVLFGLLLDKSFTLAAFPFFVASIAYFYLETLHLLQYKVVIIV